MRRFSSKAQKVIVSPNNIVGFAACGMTRIFVTSARESGDTLLVPAGIMVCFVGRFMGLAGVDVLFTPSACF